MGSVESFARNYLEGEWSGEGDIGTSMDPADWRPVGDYSLGSESIAAAAVDAARNAFENSPWSSSPRLRAEVLSEFADRLEDRREALARLLVQENGKTLAQANHEIAAGFGEARYYAGLARNVFGRTTETGPGRLSLLTREAAGVAAIIVPWNAPVTLLVRSVAPALAAGCTVVIKPAPQTPIVNAHVVACFHEISSLPKGVVNSVNEHGISVADTLIEHPEVDVVGFTGSTRTGKLVMEKAARTLKRVSLELGGKAPALVFPDAELDVAVREIRRAAIALTGQMCTAVSRVLVHEQIAETMKQRLVEALASVKVGNGLLSDTEMGPLIDRNNQARVLHLIERAADEGNLLLRGEVPGHTPRKGAFVTLTVFEIDNVDSPLVQAELFAPMISVETFSGEDEAVSLANVTRYGLAASVFTNCLKRSMRLARKLRFGTVWLNCHNRLLAEAETGGYRESGIGRLHGPEGLNDFLETKHIYLEAGS